MGSFFMPNNSFTPDVKMLVIQYLEEGRYTLEEICTMFSVSMTTLYEWRAHYKYGGSKALIRPNKNKVYSEELKQTAVEDYLTENYSMFDILAKYGISSKSVFKKWLKFYTSHSKLNDLDKGMSQTMTSRIRIQNCYMVIQELAKNENLSIVLLCQIAKVSRAAYYKWLNHQPTVLELENQQLVKSIQHLYIQVYGIYGYRRITMTINRKRETKGLKKVNKKRIYRLMQICGLEAVIRRRRKKYPKVKPDYVTENVLAREFTAEKPNQKWCTNVTEFKYGNGEKAYLSAIIDLYDKSVVSYVLGHANNNDLVFKTVRPAIRTLQDNEFPLLHSDRGYQYTSKEFKRILDKAEMIHSMSRVGRCIDNGPIESFWGTLKVEKYYLYKFDSFEALKHAIDTYITFYNNERFQEKLNGLSPLEYRAQAA